MSDLISRLIDENDIIKMLNTMDRYTSEELTLCDTDKTFPMNEVFIVDDVFEGLDELPPAQPDISGYSDRLWKAAYERGKAEAQANIIHCGECKHRIEHKHYGDLGESAYTCEGNMGGWILPDGYCSYAERRTDETD